MSAKATLSDPGLGAFAVTRLVRNNEKRQKRSVNGTYLYGLIADLNAD